MDNFFQKQKLTGTISIEKEYTTSDLCLAVILKMNGGKIKKIMPIDQRKFVFHFEENEKLDSIVKDYFVINTNDHPYKKFFNEMKEIKNMIYNWQPPIDK